MSCNVVPASRGADVRRWSPSPPSVPGIYLFCNQQGWPASRLLVEPRFGRLAARVIGEDEWVHVRAMNGWWCLEEERRVEKQFMETDGADFRLVRLDWLP